MHLKNCYNGFWVRKKRCIRGVTQNALLQIEKLVIFNIRRFFTCVCFRICHSWSSCFFAYSYFQKDARAYKSYYRLDISCLSFETLSIHRSHVECIYEQQVVNIRKYSVLPYYKLVNNSKVVTYVFVIYCSRENQIFLLNLVASKLKKSVKIRANIVVEKIHFLARLTVVSNLEKSTNLLTNGSKKKFKFNH